MYGMMANGCIFYFIYNYNDRLDENHWSCELNIDNVNDKDLIIVPTIED